MDNSLSSYYGHMNYCNSYKLKEKIKYVRNVILKKFYLE